MDEVKLCPMCRHKHNVIEVEKGTRYNCKENRQYYLHDSIYFRGDKLETERRLNAIYNFIERKPYSIQNDYKHYWFFFYDETLAIKEDNVSINVFRLMQEYPFDVADRIDKILLNLAHEYPLLSDMFSVHELAENKFRMLFCESKDHLLEVRGIISLLLSSKYIELAYTVANDSTNEKSKYRLTADGWKRISELRRTNELSKQGFIAMSFDPSISNIEEAFKRAITVAGYKPQIIKDKEHNNYIMPEIFYEIKNSRFVVVDVTKPNYGAYYEAGYAQALGKEVIVCCRKDVFDGKNSDNPKPHFDISQKSMIIWESDEELVIRLARRIEATVGKR